MVTINRSRIEATCNFSPHERERPGNSSGIITLSSDPQPSSMTVGQWERHIPAYGNDTLARLASISMTNAPDRE